MGLHAGSNGSTTGNLRLMHGDPKQSRFGVIGLVLQHVD
jgi:hypothetical protein